MTTITVCSACLRASCWQGAFYCEGARTAGTVERTVAELRQLGREAEHYWAGDLEADLDEEAKRSIHGIAERLVQAHVDKRRRI